MSEYSVEELKSSAITIRSMRWNADEGEEMMRVAEMLTACADLLERIEADEGAVPFGYLGAREMQTMQLLGHAQLLRRPLPDLHIMTPVYLRPPAQPAQLWEMKQRACRAHALCNELRLAHPEIPELGDDGVLHEAIHDILRVDTPMAAPAQAAQVDADLYKSACDSVEEWKARAMKAEEVSDRLMAEINDMTGPTFMGEPVLPARAAPDAKAMADRLMGWRLPDDFAPDAGISFAKPKNPAWWPTGTNLLTAAQAEQMFRYVLAAAPQPGESA